MNASEVFIIIGMLVAFVGSACRWRADLARVSSPMHFAPTEWGWWLPPLPHAREFATGDARKLEVVGRVLSYVGTVGALAVMLWVRHSSG